MSDWNVIALQAVAASATPRPAATGSIDLATVHAAVHDAVAAIEGKFHPYHFTMPGASGSLAAAVAAAAHDVLVNRFPAQTAALDAAYNNYLTANSISPVDPGIAVGQQAAADIIAFRAGDGAFPAVPPPPFIGGTEPGEWRPTGPAFLPMAATWTATMRPFTLTSASQFLAPPPPALKSGLYTRDYNEVKRLGALTGSTRTAEQTELAHFWNLNQVAVWNEVMRNVAAARITSISDSARLFALANMAIADAAITAWNTKLHYNLWRPVTAIQEGDNDGNPHTAGDPTWQSLIPNPPYPDYTSGANNVTGSATRMLRLFFETNELTFSVTTTNAVAVQKTRTYSHITHAAAEVVDARVYQGIHFLFADSEARHQGESVAKWAFKNFLRPVNE